MLVIRKVALGALALLLGIGAGVALLGVSGPPIERSEEASPARRLSPASSAQHSAVDAALAHVQSTAPSVEQLHGEVVFGFPTDEDRVKVRVAGRDFCSIYTAHRLTSASSGDEAWQVPPTSDGVSCTP